MKEYAKLVDTSLQAAARAREATGGDTALRESAIAIASAFAYMVATERDANIEREREAERDRQRREGLCPGCRYREDERPCVACGRTFEP